MAKITSKRGNFLCFARVFILISWFYKEVSTSETSCVVRPVEQFPSVLKHGILYNQWMYSEPGGWQL